LVNPIQQSHNGPLDYAVGGASNVVQILQVNIEGEGRHKKMILGDASLTSIMEAIKVGFNI